MTGREITVMRGTRCQRLVSFYLAILLLVIASSGSSAQLTEATDSLSVSDFTDANLADTPIITNSGSDGTADIAVQNWRGFAMKEDESHPLRLNLETIRTVNPGEARRLLASNISLEEVRSQARAGERDVVRRGSMRLNNDVYMLTDITLTSAGNRSTLEANLASSGSRSDSGDAASAVGHMVVTISVIDDKEVAEGTLIIDDSKYRGTYSLLLNERPGRGPRAGMLGRA